MNSKSFSWLMIFLGIFLLLAISCKKEETFITDENALLAFSLDTLRFDTVFTQIGSSTRFFKVYNRNDQAIKISSIKVAGSSGVFFRINVDGVPGNNQSEVEINAKDSIYVFVEVTVDPDQPSSISPFVIEDNVVFTTNGNEQKVNLEAWGQNANYFPSRFGKGTIWSPCTIPSVIWNDSKPYVIYGILFIDDCILNIAPGTRIYVHGGITRNSQLGVYNDGLIFVGADGKLNIGGTLENPVIIQGDRLEEAFEERTGQWSGIIIDNESTGNVIEYTEIKNSSLGLAVDSAANATLKNVQIHHTSSAGLIGIHAAIQAENCLFHTNGGNAVQLAYGGSYKFTYCTLASYGVDATALSMSNGTCDDPPFCESVRGNPIYSTFVNSIIFGSRNDEIGMINYQQATGASFNYAFENCIVRVRDLVDKNQGGVTDFFDYCNPCINANGSDTLFASIDTMNYRLDTLSIAERKAKPLLDVSIDLEGNQRDGQNPDIGCFEYQY